jgi:hypothetical protein
MRVSFHQLCHCNVSMTKLSVLLLIHSLISFHVSGIDNKSSFHGSFFWNFLHISSICVSFQQTDRFDIMIVTYVIILSTQLSNVVRNGKFYHVLVIYTVIVVVVVLTREMIGWMTSIILMDSLSNL